MTLTEQRAAIAKDQGWIFLGSPGFHDDNWKSWLSPDRTRTNDLPDYLNSRDAIIEAVRGLGDKQKSAFAFTLWKMVEGEGTDTLDDYFSLITATAAQLSEAYLRARGLWKEKNL